MQKEMKAQIGLKQCLNYSHTSGLPTSTLLKEVTTILVDLTLLISLYTSGDIDI